MEHHNHFWWVNQLFLWAIFNSYSYVKLPEGTIVHPHCEDVIAITIFDGEIISVAQRQISIFDQYHSSPFPRNIKQPLNESML